MIKKLIIKCFILSLYLFLPASIYAQNIRNERAFKKMMLEAESLFQYESDYDKAIPILLDLLEKDPENTNVAYKLGVCFLSTEHRIDTALKYLQLATRDIVVNRNYDRMSHQAPQDALFYLGYAYQTNNQLEKAIEYYKKFRSSLPRDDIYEIEFIDKQIEACKQAQTAIDNPLLLERELSELPVNDFFKVLKPVLSSDGRTLAFTVTDERKNRIFLSEHDSSGWSVPVDITRELKAGSDAVTNHISSEGNTLILYKSDGMDGNLYHASREDGTWRSIRSFNKSINSKYWESHGWFNKDQSVLYFASNRPGGYGELDIYYSVKNSHGEWSAPKNLGAPVNSELEDNTPMLMDNDSILLFSSQGHASIGGYDFYRSRLNKEGKWSQPVNLGYPLNTTDDDAYLLPVYKDSVFLQPLYTETTAAEKYYATTVLPQQSTVSRMIRLIGSLTFEDHLVPHEEKLTLRIQGAETDTSWHIPADGEEINYSISLPPEKLRLEIQAKGYGKVTEHLDLGLLPESRQEYSLSSTLTPLEVAKGSFLYLNNILFALNSAELNDTSRAQLEKLVGILAGHPGLSLEVTGYTDNTGSDPINRALSLERAYTVAGYLNEAGIDSSRLTVSGAGASDFLARNITKESRDEPTGRKYNRRVNLRIKNPGSDIQITYGSYIPEYLRNPYAYRYYIILMETSERLYPSFFQRYQLDELLFVRPVKAQAAYLYTLGEYPRRLDALRQLIRVREAGFKEAFILNQHELKERTEQSLSSRSGNRPGGVIPLYTIQVHALKSPLSTEQKARNPEMREIYGEDGFYRYTIGEYKGYSAARTALKKIRKAGFPNAFVKEISLLESQTLGVNGTRQ